MMNCCGAAREGPCWGRNARNAFEAEGKKLTAGSSQSFYNANIFFFPFGGGFLPANTLTDSPCLDEWLQCQPMESISFQPEMSEGVKPTETFPPHF